MKKEQVQQRTMKNGKKLALSKFSWDEKTNTFATDESNVVLDLSEMNDCTIRCGSDCTITCGDYCTIRCGSDCTIRCGSRCAITYGYGCTIRCGSDCTITCGYGCTIRCGSRCVIIRKDTYQVIETSNSTIEICPYDIKGYVQNGIYSETNRPSIIADGILSEVIKTKGQVRKVINHGETKPSYLLEVDGVFSHGKTLKEARESFKYKISSRDTSQYDGLTLESKLTESEAIKLYRTITGACESGTKYFVEQLQDVPKSLNVKKLIELTTSQFNHEMLVEFFKEKNKA